MKRLISILTAGCLLFCLAGCSKLENATERILCCGLDMVCSVLSEIKTKSSAALSAEYTFYDCTGYRDWYRFPLKYPYHFLMIDCRTAGCLEKYTGGDIQDPMNSSEPVKDGSGIIRLFWDDQLIVFDRKDGQCGVLVFQDKICHIFSTAEERNIFLKKHYPALQSELHTPEYYYQQFQQKVLK